MNLRSLFLLLAAVTALALPSCVSSSVSLDYQPRPGQMMRGNPEFTVGAFHNGRKEPPYYLGTVRTPIGTPVENVQTRTPIEQIVGNAFAHALDARGMLATGGREKFILTGDVLDLYCQQIVHPYGYARIRVNVIHAASGGLVFSRIYVGERQSAAYMPGSGSPIPLLRELTSRALQDAVDNALDDREMRARLRGSAPRYTPGML
ncbi:MAG: hypothetical protein KDK99_21655 [Verrucomicrobiales bacterium]|nr:hypothetical protein [Verrucomicrobiales bacterium]